MKTVSMEISKDELKTYAPDCSPSKYGYGLQLYLNDDQCKKLGLDKALPAGTIVKLEASAIVESATERVERKDGEGPQVNLSLQITDLCAEPQGTAAHPA